ncbi:MAG: toast rack family protein [Anaerolineales bacterium]|nr:toast rack family protein [Anaerolineales bacterium]
MTLAEKDTVKRLLISIAALAVAALACDISLPNIPRLQTIPTETLVVAEPLPDGETAEVELRLGAGELTLSGGGEGLIGGEIRYNVAEWKPTVTRDGNRVHIEQDRMDSGSFGIIEGDVLNEWNLKLGNVPLKLKIDAGAYRGELDLSGVPLRRLDIADGAGTSTVKFESVNPEEMTELRYTTAASTVTLEGLANANFATMRFDGGAGTYTLDFSGELQRDATVTITAGICTLKIIIPEGTPAKINRSGALTTVNTEGRWSVDGDTYEKSGNGPMLTINVELDAGTLTLVNK